MVPGLYRDSVISASGVVTRRFGNKTTSYTVLYSSTPVVGRGRLAVLPGRVLSCPSGGSVSGSNGPREPRSRVTRGPLVLSRSILCLLYPFGGIFLVLDSSALCAVSRVRFFCPYPGNVYVASGPGAICWACFSRCLLGSLSLCTFHLLCSFLHSRRGELLIPIGGFLCVAAEWVARLCRESVSGPPAPCKA